ncbi:type II toxin-antitoxin system VapC family toxin [Mesorhizobium sp. RP14(2022)]|uniref:Ribonuclease VapC n=1 Tax=Mesorhizobium liriopis TaxID=2953882 RepID=A0ABT1C357_9HYPH|nr:type II toxin-antitoxin system VapC family toxin [Mesorhizobium liriopis]MCO6049078.1 type II toxin-antitoxin system VapC family toxin [Mesorhizobium liriopis]
MFLFDTVVVSESFKTQPNTQVLAWLRSVPSAHVFISVVTAGELQRGIQKLEALEKRRPERFIKWAAETIGHYGDRVLPITVPIARRWGDLSFRLGNTNPDLLIAATALEHDLTVVTRNSRHFEPTGVKLLNPYLSEGPYAPARLGR